MELSDEALEMMARKKKVEEPSVLEIGGVPTAAGLAKMGRRLAYIRADNKMHITPEGHAVMGVALRKNAEARIARGEGDWVRPKSSGPIVQGGES